MNGRTKTVSPHAARKLLEPLAFDIDRLKLEQMIIWRGPYFPGRGWIWNRAKLNSIRVAAHRMGQSLILVRIK